MIAEKFAFSFFGFGYLDGMPIMAILSLLSLLLSSYDFRHRNIPNWATLPLLIAGIIAHIPDTPTVDFSSALLVLSCFAFGDKIGAGDIKLWLALIWSVPSSMEDIASITMFIVLTTTAGSQILLRKFRKRTPVADDTAAPAAWRTAVFMLLLNIFYFFPIPHV